MNIGTKVKHNDQDIVGTIIRYDCGDKVVIELDDEDTTLSYHPRELTIMKEETKTYIVEWQEIVTYSEEVEAKNEDEALMIAGADYDIVDQDVVDGSTHIEEVQQ